MKPKTWIIRALALFHTILPTSQLTNSKRIYQEAASITELPTHSFESGLRNASKMGPHSYGITAACARGAQW